MVQIHTHTYMNFNLVLLGPFAVRIDLPTWARATLPGPQEAQWRQALRHQEAGST